MIINFGWKALLGILISNGIYFFVFRKELARLQKAFALRAVKDRLQRKYLSHRNMEARFDQVVESVNEEMKIAASKALAELAKGRLRNKLKEYREANAEGCRRAG